MGYVDGLKLLRWRGEGGGEKLDRRWMASNEFVEDRRGNFDGDTIWVL